MEPQKYVTKVFETNKTIHRKLKKTGELEPEEGILELAILV